MGNRRDLAVLMVSVADVELAVPLENVRQVLPQLATRPLPFGPAYLAETFDFGDEAVGVLDLAVALGVEHRAALLDRRLIVVRHEGLLLALSVDEVRDPREFSADDVMPADRLGGAAHVSRVLRAIVRTADGSLPVVDPAALLSPELVRDLARALAQAKTSHAFEQGTL